MFLRFSLLLVLLHLVTFCLYSSSSFCISPLLLLSSLNSKQQQQQKQQQHHHSTRLFHPSLFPFKTRSSTSASTSRSGSGGGSSSSSRRRTTHVSWSLSSSSNKDNEYDDDDMSWPYCMNRDDKDDNNENNNNKEEEKQQEFCNQKLDAVVRVHCTHNEPDYLMPWQKAPQSISTSTGFVVEYQNIIYILTNAHSVEYGTIIQLQKRGDAQKYRAKIVSLINECDLAILELVLEDDDDMNDNKDDNKDDDNNNNDDDNTNDNNNNNDDEIYGGGNNNYNHNNNKNKHKFWYGIQPLQFGTLPLLQEEIQVLGYPTGGDSLSITKGVVSRIEMQDYTQGSISLLAIQIDAAINSGNSGGPIVKNNQEEWNVVGVAFQGLEDAENIGYGVPVTIVKHVLSEIANNNNKNNKNRNNGQEQQQQKRKKYTGGFCSLGVSFALLENTAFRKSLGLNSNSSSNKDKNNNKNNNKNRTKILQEQGIVIKSVHRTSRAKDILQCNDVILSMDDIPIGMDGKIPFRHGERVNMSCYLHMKSLDDFVQLNIWRKQQFLILPKVPVSSMIQSQQRLVPAHWSNQSPPYLIVGGFVFTVLSTPYLTACGAWDSYVSDQVNYLSCIRQQQYDDNPLLSSNHYHHDRKEIVILIQVLAHSTNLGYDTMTDLHLERVNGQSIKSLRHLDYLLQHDLQQEEFIKFEFSPNQRIAVLERSTLQAVTYDICQEHSIPNPSFLHDDDNDEEEEDNDDDKEKDDQQTHGRGDEQTRP